jgi:hypothetical protein
MTEKTCHTLPQAPKVVSKAPKDFGLNLDMLLNTRDMDHSLTHSLTHGLYLVSTAIGERKFYE